jgi:pyruvate formate lyase activating enzyme
MKEGWITDIQRFSLNDGSGIRTTVFFKGCNMRCLWCHNPETLSFDPSLMYYKSKCIGCLHCIKVCPKGALSVNEKGIAVDRTVCAKCGICTRACYPQALVLCGRLASVDTILTEVEQDRAYYNNSNGGITLSGGEVLCQAEFAEAIIDACKTKDIPVTLETNLGHPFKKIENILKKVSYIFADIKLIDSEEHKKWVGVDNGSLLENIQRLSNIGVPFTIRTPLIPNVTDTDANLKGILDFLSKIEGVEKWELMNFNPLGAGKYENLSMENQFHDARPLLASKLQGILEKLKGHEIAVNIA